MDQCTRTYSCLEVTKQNWVTQTCTDRPLLTRIVPQMLTCFPSADFWPFDLLKQQSAYIPLVNMISEGLLEGNLLQFTESILVMKRSEVCLPVIICPTYSCKHDNSGTLRGNFFKSGPNFLLDPKLLDFTCQRSNVKGTVAY